MKSDRSIVFETPPRAGVPDLAQCALRETPLPVPAAGEALVRNLYLSIDSWLVTALELLLPGTTIPGDAVRQVVLSRHPLFRPGDVVQGYLGWQEFAAASWHLLGKVDPTTAPISTALGILGSTGVTAYVGTYGIGKARAGETVVVSAAAGAVGSAEAQLAILAGRRVIGIAGSAEKVRYLAADLHVDTAIDYKSGKDWRMELRVACPFGVDVYFDNVGGRISEAVAPLLNTHARLVVCGQIAEYGSPLPRTRWPWLPLVLERRLRVEGFLVTDFAHRFTHALCMLQIWLRAGLISYRETRAHGLERAPEAFTGMRQGRNIGKQLVEL